MIYFYVSLLGGILGASEIMGRYVGSPLQVVLLNWATAIYCIVNALISVFSYLLIDQLNWIDFPDAAEQAEQISKILVAGFGAATLLRLGLSFQVAGQTMNLSLMTVFEPILNAADNVIRQSANTRNLADSSEIMADLTEEEAFDNLPEPCFKLARLQDERAEELSREIDSIRQSDQLQPIKVQYLGRLLLQIVGKDVLDSLAKSVRAAR